MVCKNPRFFVFMLLSEYMFRTMHFSSYFNRLLINNMWEIWPWYSHTTQIYVIFIISSGKSSCITITFKCKCRVMSLDWKVIHIMSQCELERLAEIQEEILIEAVPGEKWTCRFFGCFYQCIHVQFWPFPSVYYFEFYLFNRNIRKKKSERIKFGFKHFQLHGRGHDMGTYWKKALSPKFFNV